MPRPLPDALAHLPLAVETASFTEVPLPAGSIRPCGTALVRLTGAGAQGIGEDVSPYAGEDMDRFAGPPSGVVESLVGSWTLQAFTDHVFATELWQEEPAWDLSINFRRWAFQSAALDLALRQAGTSLPQVLDRAPSPLRFVNSLGLGDEPSFDEIRARLDAYPALHFKLDAAPAWSAALMDELAGTGAVDVVDFKGQYDIEVPDEDALVAMYREVVARFPDALLEDPHDLDAVTDVMVGAASRVTYDAPIRTIADIEARVHRPVAVNVKPCRVGDLAELLAIYAFCDEQGLPIYSGGMGELDAGRGQAQLLAAMFHPDAPNDIAPSAYNEQPLPAGLPVSPLVPGRIVGFRWG